MDVPGATKSVTAQRRARVERARTWTDGMHGEALDSLAR